MKLVELLADYVSTHALASHCQDLPYEKETIKPPRLLCCTLRTRPHTNPGSSCDLNLDASRLER